MRRTNLKAVRTPKPATSAEITRKIAAAEKGLREMTLDVHTEDDTRRIMLGLSEIILAKHAADDTGSSIDQDRPNRQPARHLTLEAARDLAYWAHAIAAAAITTKLGVDALSLEHEVEPHGYDTSTTKELGAQAGIDALAEQAKHVLQSLREFRAHDAAGD